MADHKSMKNSNAAQIYGATLSYARRYTAFMALGLATEDDQVVEEQSMVTAKPVQPAKPASKKPSEKDVQKKRLADICKKLKTDRGVSNDMIQT